MSFTEFSAGELANLHGTDLLAYIQKLFKQWGIYNQKLTLNHQGAEFAFSCHDNAFVVYRLLPAAGNPRGAPGWPVCLVTADGVIDECSPPHDAEDHFACRLGLADWLALIQQSRGRP